MARSTPILKSIPKGIPKLIRPKLGGRNKVDLAELETKVKASSHRMTNDEVAWWSSFITKERESREMWNEITPEQLKNTGKRNWPLLQIKPFNAGDLMKHEAETDDQRRQREELERLSRKENHFPPVCIGKSNINKVLSCDLLLLLFFSPF